MSGMSCPDHRRASRRAGQLRLPSQAPGQGTPSRRSSSMPPTTTGGAGGGHQIVFRRDRSHGVYGRVRERIGVKRVLDLVKAFLKAGILGEDQVVRDTVTGNPQGGILSPLLANIALSVLDEHFMGEWESWGGQQGRSRRRRQGLANYRLVRYACGQLRPRGRIGRLDSVRRMSVRPRPSPRVTGSLPARRDLRLYPTPCRRRVYETTIPMRGGRTRSGHRQGVCHEACRR
jgi:hypothetical protein